MQMKNMWRVLVCIALSACDSSQDKPPSAVTTVAAASAPAAVALPPASAASAIPAPLPMVRGLDVGKTDSEPTRTTGSGKSMSAAVNDAIRNAILQANGTTVDLTSQQFKFALDVATDVADVGIRASAFANVVEQRSRGAITGFKLESSQGPDASGNYQVWIEAAVAKYKPPEAESKKIKLVIAPIRFDVQAFTVGQRSVPASEVAQVIRNQIQDSLTQSGRFAILERQFNPEVEQELDLIASGSAPNSQFGKLGQAFSADLVWTGRIHALGYVRHTKQLRMSDRSLVSYSGGWAFSQKLLNVVTRQVVLANSMNDQMPSTAPTTLGASVDSGKTLSEMTNAIAQQVVSSIMVSSFPVSVVSRDGNAVILSQGGNALYPGVRYQIISLGSELKDPQTGLSLGSTESNCCEVVIDRVTPTLSYGHLENIKIALDSVPAGGLLVREPIWGDYARAAQNAKASGSSRARPPKGGDMPEPASIKKPKSNEADW